MTNVLLVFAGGGLGSALRYLVGLLFRSITLSLPVATFVSNMLACLVFALVVYYDRARQPFSPGASLLLLTGFCGGLSTFSTFGFETFLLIRNGMVSAAVLNVLLSTLLALGMFYMLVKQVG